MFANSQSAPVGSNTLTILIWSLYFGVVLSVLYSTLQKRIIGTFVRKLIKNGISTAEKAQTLSELNYKYVLPILVSLNGRSSPLRKIIYIVGEENADEISDTDDSAATQNIAETKQIKKYDRKNIGNVRFYLPDSNIIRAESIYGKNDVNPFIVFAAAVLFFAVAIACFALIPKIIQLIQTFLNSIKI